MKPISEMDAHEAFGIATKGNTFGESPAEGEVRRANAIAAAIRMDEIIYHTYPMEIDEHGNVGLGLSIYNADDLIAMLLWAKMKREKRDRKP